ncbi:OmpH family outer membrane protein [Qipengyuania sp. DY56-A-20]|jgi:Skp family chaperone for outer membrane proteins|uniref:OmpH family outer membrane protein n=1 Tax=Qipengyuania benthica TaxID=3067651 RepID=A0ABT9H6Y7_9SPHN|nr:OmpH family outer membrane protein [Qipengyuania sp. DY56-A-20]MDP4539088.1 OmpH family outer membrane protein [Qipengyuania sp. DY56-A-20]
MKFLAKTLASASLAAAVFAAAPASAQVQGNIAVVNTPLAIAQTNALRTAFQQVGTTYQTQITTIQQRQQQIETLLTQLDTNNDGGLDEAEQAAAQTTPQWQQIQQIEREVGQLTNQIDMARAYALEQILRQYSPTLQQVVTQNQVQMVVAPDSVIYAQPAADMTGKVVAALNTAVPSVQTTPPAGWQPSRQTVSVYQQVQQIFAIAQQQAQQQQAQQPTQQPNGR